MSCIFNILRFLSKGSVCALYVLIDIILIAFICSLGGGVLVEFQGEIFLN